MKAHAIFSLTLVLLLGACGRQAALPGGEEAIAPDRRSSTIPAGHSLVVTIKRGNGKGKVRGPQYQCGEEFPQCSGVYPTGTTGLTYVATPAASSEFLGWGNTPCVQGTASRSCTIAVPGRVDLQPRFRLSSTPRPSLTRAFLLGRWSTPRLNGSTLLDFRDMEFSIFTPNTQLFIHINPAPTRFTFYVNPPTDEVYARNERGVVFTFFVQIVDASHFQLDGSPTFLPNQSLLFTRQ